MPSLGIPVFGSPSGVLNGTRVALKTHKVPAQFVYRRKSLSESIAILHMDHRLESTFRGGLQLGQWVTFGEVGSDDAKPGDGVFME